MIRVDLYECTGCQLCLDTCPVEAIYMQDGKAAIDVDVCHRCGACFAACPQGAISEAKVLENVPEAFAVGELRPAALPTTTLSSENRFALAGMVLSFVGKEIVPRVIDVLIAALDRRLSVSTPDQAVLGLGSVCQANGARRQVRRRRRGKSF
jgi:NAD-dependent dihydropyrimidine dehydrogenase PreA subunit